MNFLSLFKKKESLNGSVDETQTNGIDEAMNDTNKDLQISKTEDRLNITRDKLNYWIKSIKFNDGTNIQLEKNDIIVFVGPNNSGKSVTLKEIKTLSTYNAKSTKVLLELEAKLELNGQSIESYIESVSRIARSGQADYYKGLDFDIYDSALTRSTNEVNNNLSQGLKDIVDIFINTLTTEKRLTAANPPENIRISIDPLVHPIHHLQKDDSLETAFSNFFRQAFGTDLIVHRNAGKTVPLYVGKKPILKEGEDRVSEGYISELESLDLLHEQGDGMRSFVGVLLTAFVAHHPVLLIDEPEAFLHPPQANLLGRMLAKNLPSAKQLFLSTHSEAFLKGLLDSNNPNLKIIRLQREVNINKASVLESIDISQIWSDSLLRHSNILDGLFHSTVVVCESDSDARFYSAILSAIYEDSGLKNPDMLFIQCGGKHRISVVVRALKKLNVPIKIIFDFDILNNIDPLKRIYEDLGGTWQDIEVDWKLVKMSIDQKKPELETHGVREEIRNILESVNEKIFPKNKINEINKILAKASAWSQAKQVGKAYIPNGDASKAYDRMQTKLIQVGLLVVEVGELESFDKSSANHGPKWISEVMSKDLKNDAGLEVARQFVKQLVA